MHVAGPVRHVPGRPHGRRSLRIAAAGQDAPEQAHRDVLTPARAHPAAAEFPQSALGFPVLPTPQRQLAPQHSQLGGTYAHLVLVGVVDAEIDVGFDLVHAAQPGQSQDQPGAAHRHVPVGACAPRLVERLQQDRAAGRVTRQQLRCPLLSKGEGTHLGPPEARR